MPELTKKELRKKRAAEKMKQLNQASKSNRMVENMDWKPKAKVFIHPDSDIYERYTVWFPCESEEQVQGKRGRSKTIKKVINYPFVVSPEPNKNPFQILVNKLKEDDEIDLDEIILSVGSGRAKLELSKGQIIGHKEYGYKHRLIYSKDFITAGILIADKKNNRPDKLKIEKLIGKASLAREIVKAIEAEVDELGEDDGSPFISPYPFLIEFDEDAPGSSKYSASARLALSPDEGDKELLDLLDADPPTFEKELELDSFNEIAEMINSALVYEGLEIELDGKKKKKKTTKKVESDLSEDEDDTEEDTEEEEKPVKSTKSKKKVSKKKSSKKVVKKVEEEEEDEENGEDEENDDEEPVSDEDDTSNEDDNEDEDVEDADETVKEDADEVENDHDEDDEDDHDEDEDEEKVVNEKPKKKKFSKKVLKKVEEENGEDEDDHDEDDEEEDDLEEEVKPSKKKTKKKAAKKAPTKKKSGKKKTVKKEAKKLAWEPAEGEDYDFCPACNEKVSVDAEKCPHCGVEFDSDDFDE